MTFIKQLVKQIFQYEARLILKKYKPKIIGITGSVGKSTTRDAIYLVLSKNYFVRKNEKSFTTELGIPLAIIGCAYGTGSVWQWIKNVLLGFQLLITSAQYPDWLILEIDGDRRGDFIGLSEWLHPDILVLTAIGEIPAHVEGFGNSDMLLEEKKTLLNAMKRDGVVIYNCDDFHARELAASSEQRKISCGIGSGSDICGNEFTILYGTSNGRQVPTGMVFEITGTLTNTYTEKISRENVSSEKPIHAMVTIFNSIGVHNVYACLIATAIGHELNVSAEHIFTAFNQYETLPGRMKIISGIKDSVIIDDSYNASPVAMRESILTFLDVKTAGRKIVVLGDMFELGKFSVEEHKKIASLVTDISYFISVGIRSRSIAEELLSLGFNESHVLSVDNAEGAGREVERILEYGDCVFVKGSQAMRMERTVEEIMRHPQDKKMLLVRQEPEWLLRN